MKTMTLASAMQLHLQSLKDLNTNFKPIKVQNTIHHIPTGNKTCLRVNNFNRFYKNDILIALLSVV